VFQLNGAGINNALSRSRISTSPTTSVMGGQSKQGRDKFGHNPTTTVRDADLFSQVAGVS